MDSGAPEQLPPHLAIQAIAIVSAIFVVLFALWADYFGHYAEKAAGMAPKDDSDEEEEEVPVRRGPRPPYDPTVDLSKIRMASLMTLVFQALLYFGAGEVRAAYPLSAHLVFLAAFVVQAYVQATLERRVRELGKTFTQALSEAERKAVDPEPRERMAQAGRAFAWSLVAGATHLSIFMVTLVAFFAAGQALDLSRPAMAGVVLLGTLAALLASLASTFVLAPFQLRRALPCTSLDQDALRERILSDFAAAGLAAPDIWVLETGRERGANAMISGFAHGRGPLRPALFLTRSLVSQLAPEQVRAIVRHEISHCVLHHLRARLLFSGAIVAAVLVVAVTLVVAVHAFAPGSALAAWIAPFSGFAAFAGFAAFVGRQMRRHELEADRHSVTRLGNDPAVLADSLTRLDEINRREPAQESATHPSTASRVALLRALALEQAASQAPAQVAATEDRRDRAA